MGARADLQTRSLAPVADRALVFAWIGVGPGARLLDRRGEGRLAVTGSCREGAGDG